jgi:2-polyprenyl-3-methyl-5-hydroxy-6-metoxy-1,4-benzoquinol methylase
MTTYKIRPSADTRSAYVLDNANPQPRVRFSALPALYDSGTIRCLSEIGVEEGWHCLEVGAGPGSIAIWLSDQVGFSGQVIATDLDTRFLRQITRSNLKIVRHDLVTESLPRTGFDLIHARLVLIHLPERDDVLRALVNALKPGGWIVIEDFDSLSMLPNPDVNPSEGALKTSIAMRDVMARNGVDLRYGRLSMQHLQSMGLVDVSADGRISMWQGKSAGTELMRANFLQLETAMIASGLITKREFDQDLARLDESNFLVPSPIMWSVRGRRVY